MLELQLLGGHLRRVRLVDAVPEGCVQPDAAGDDVDVLAGGVLMYDRREHVTGWIQSYLAHEICGDPAPPIRVEVLACQKGQGAMPDRPGAIRT